MKILPQIDMGNFSLPTPVYYIYTLRDPRDQVDRYVGRTIRPKSRYLSHLDVRANTSPKNLWVKELSELGLKPSMHLIESCSFEESGDRELYWIDYYQSQTGGKLTNSAVFPRVAKVKIRRTRTRFSNRSAETLLKKVPVAEVPIVVIPPELAQVTNSRRKKSEDAKNEDAVRFGLWFKARREKAGYKTKAQFARAFSTVGASALSQVESGQLLLALDTSLTLGRAVGASDIETITAMGLLQNVTEADAQLVELIRRLSGEDRALLEEFARVMLRRAEARNRG